MEPGHAWAGRLAAGHVAHFDVFGECIALGLDIMEKVPTDTAL